ncbi:MAG: hypothetical protein U9O90_01355 [Euryarchaeota archaeon]|nr:hypothetical protein [Euryarchaeota archaeon]
MGDHLYIYEEGTYEEPWGAPFTCGDANLLNILFLMCSEDTRLARQLLQTLAAAYGYDVILPCDLTDSQAFITWLEGFHQHLSTLSDSDGIAEAMKAILPGTVEYLREMSALDSASTAQESEPPELWFVLSPASNDTVTTSEIVPVKGEIMLITPGSKEPTLLTVVEPAAQEIFGPAYGSIKLVSTVTNLYQRHPKFKIGLEVKDTLGEIASLNLTVQEGWGLYSGMVALASLFTNGYMKLAEYKVVPDLPRVGTIKGCLKTVTNVNDGFMLVIDSIKLGEEFYDEHGEQVCKFIEDPSGDIVLDIVLDYKLWAETLMLAASVASVAGVTAPIAVGLGVLGAGIEYLGDRITSRWTAIWSKAKLQRNLGIALTDLLYQLDTITTLEDADYFDAEIAQAREHYNACATLKERLAYEPTLFAQNLRTYLDIQMAYYNLREEKAEDLKDAAGSAREAIEDAIKVALDHGRSKDHKSPSVGYGDGPTLL